MAPRLKELTQGGDRKNLNALIKPELLIQEADVSKDLNKKVDSYLSGLDSSISAYFQRFFLGDRGLRQEIREATLRNEKLNIQAQLPFYLSNLNSNLNASLPQNYQKLVRDLNSYASNISTVHGTKAWDALDASIKNYFEPNMRIYQDFGIAQNKIALGNESAYILNNDTKTLNYYDGSNQSQKEIADFSKHLLTWNAVQVLFNSLRIKGTNQKSQVLTSSQFMHLTHFALQVNPGAEFKIRSLNKDVPFQVTKGILPLIHQLSRNNRLTIELNNMKSQGFSSVEQTTKTIRDKILTKISDIKTRSNTQSPAYGKLLTAIENYLKSGGSKESVDNLTQAIKTHEGLWFRRWGFEKLFPQDIDRVLDLINLAKESPFFNSALLTIKLQKDGTLTPDPANQTSIDPDILTTVREPFNELKKFQDQVQSTFSGHLDSLTDAINALKGKNYDQASELEARLNTLKNYRQFEITHITEQINETEQLIKDSSAIINIPTSQLGKNPEDLTSTTNDGVEAIKTLTRIFNLPNRTSIPRPQGKAPTPPSSRPTSGLGFSANNTSTSTQKTPEINYPDDAETKAKNSFFDDIRNKAATIKKKTPDNTDAPLPPQPRASIKPETDPKTNLSNPNPAKPASTQLLNDVLKEVKKREGKLEGNQLTDKTNSTQDNNTPPLGKNSRFFNGFEAALVQQAQSLKPVAHMSPKTEESPFEENQFKVLTPDEYTKKLDYFKSRTDQQRAKSIERQIKALKNENGIQDKEQISKQLISFVAQPDQLSMKVLWVQQTGKISPNDGGDDDDNVEEWHDSSNKPH